MVTNILGGSTVALFLLAAFLGTQLLETRELVGQLREECNVRVLDSVREATELADQARVRAHEEEVARLKAIMSDNERMVRELEERAGVREGELRAARAALREAARGETEDACIDASVPSSIWNRVRADN